MPDTDTARDFLSEHDTQGNQVGEGDERLSTHTMLQTHAALLEPGKGIHHSTDTDKGNFHWSQTESSVFYSKCGSLVFYGESLFQFTLLFTSCSCLLLLLS